MVANMLTTINYKGDTKPPRINNNLLYLGLLFLIMNIHFRRRQTIISDIQYKHLEAVPRKYSGQKAIVLNYYEAKLQKIMSVSKHYPHFISKTEN